MKKILLLATTAILLSIQTEAQEYFVLTSPIIGLVDGKSIAIDGEVFGLLLQIRREIRKRLYGIKTDSGKYLGMYDFDGEKKSVIELEIIETQLEKTYYAKLEQLQLDRNRYSEREWKLELDEIERDYLLKKELILEALHDIKEDFLDQTREYADSVRCFKDQMLILIQESSDLRGNKDNFLLKWADETEDNEGDFLRQELTSVKLFMKFASDLTNFLGDLARSCPKAKNLFMEMIKKSKNQK